MGFSKFFRTACLQSGLLVCFVAELLGDEGNSLVGDRKLPKSTTQDAGTITTLNSDFRQLTRHLFLPRIEMPPQPRVSRTHHPMRQIKLLGGDQFVAECLEWGAGTVKFRLLNGQLIQLPRELISSLENPPGEVDLFDEPSDNLQQNNGRTIVEPYTQQISPAGMARVEFQFRPTSVDFEFPCGEWELDWNREQRQQPPIVVKISAGRRITVKGVPATIEAASQLLEISADWHSFVALFEPEQIRLMIDDAILVSIPVHATSLNGFKVLPPADLAKSRLEVDHVQIRRLIDTGERKSAPATALNGDRLELTSGDQLFGRIRGLSRDATQFEDFGESQAIPWDQIAGLYWRQSDQQASQSLPPRTGIVAELDLQPFVDRLECEPEHWQVTVLRVDAKSVYAHHPWAGGMRFSWRDIRRLKPAYFGTTVCLDARRFHLGNSIRADFQRHFPDGTEVKGTFELKETQVGKAYLSFNLAELEAASPDAPPASPFLTDLRAGRLITELFVNQQKIVTLNSLVRLKASAQNPDRIRVEIPVSLLKSGQNTYQLRQQPLKAGGREYDDCELSDIRLETELQ